MFGPIGVNHRSSRRSSSNLCDSGAVLSAVLMVHTWHSVNPLDLGKWGDEVMWFMHWCWRNCASSSEVNRGPLSVCNMQGSPYCEMSSNRCIVSDWVT